MENRGSLSDERCLNKTIITDEVDIAGKMSKFCIVQEYFDTPIFQRCARNISNFWKEVVRIHMCKNNRIPFLLLSNSRLMKI